MGSCEKWDEDDSVCLMAEENEKIRSDLVQATKDRDKAQSIAYALATAIRSSQYEFPVQWIVDDVVDKGLAYAVFKDRWK